LLGGTKVKVETSRPEVFLDPLAGGGVLRCGEHHRDAGGDECRTLPERRLAGSSELHA
jgi:hypothetical protein